jgi:hypothetical protein
MRLGKGDLKKKCLLEVTLWSRETTFRSDSRSDTTPCVQCISGCGAEDGEKEEFLCPTGQLQTTFFE